jgi:hypothetical protein
MVEPGAAMLRSAHREGATMKTLALATILALSLLAAPLAAEAQQAGRVWRIGMLGFAHTDDVMILESASSIP